MKQLIFISVFYLLSLHSHSQNTVNGRVTDNNDKPLPYVSVFLTQAKNGAVTNNDGNFSVSFSDNSDVLRATSIGYETYTVKINSNSNYLKIKLKQSVTELNEVVVTNLAATELLKKAVEKIPENYVQIPFLMKTYSRSKSFKHDSLLYFEETVIDIVSSYKSGFNDEYFLTNNRNLNVSDQKQGIRRTLSYDFVKTAKETLNSDFYKKNDVKYLPSTTFDNHTVYVLSIISKKKEAEIGKIYLDLDDLAFVRIEIFSENGNRYNVQYHKIDGKYYVSNAHILYINKHRGGDVPVESDFVVTEIVNNFTKDDLTGIPVQKGDVLQSFITQQDSSFWQIKNAILPDSITELALKKHLQNNSQTYENKIDSIEFAAQIKRLYTPNLSLMASSDRTKDFASLNYNTISINHTVNHLLYRKVRKNYMLPLLFSEIYYVFSIPFEETLAEQRLLNINGLNSKINPIFLKNTESYLYGIDNNKLNNYKSINYNNFMRLHTIRNDGHYVQAQISEEELAKADLSNNNNKFQWLFYYFSELLINRSSLIYNPFGKDKKEFSVAENKQPLLIDRSRSWVKYLYEPETEYMRHVKKDNLTAEESRYLQRTAWFSWLNLVSPQMFGIHKFKLNKSTQFTFSLNYLRVPFGEMFGQNIWLTTNYNQLHGIYLKQYRNFNKTSFGIAYKFFDLKLFNNAFLTSTLEYWRQPSELKFYDTKLSDGFHVGQIFEYQFIPYKYTNANHLSLFIGYDYKTNGYMPESYFLEKKFNLNVGFKLFTFR